jgi:hypothetical protein
MLYTYRTQLIAEERHVTFDLPPEFPAGQHRVEVLVKMDETLLTRPSEVEDSYQYTDEAIKTIVNAARARRTHDEVPLGDDFFQWLDRQPGTGRTREEIDAQIAEERNSWGDD